MGWLLILAVLILLWKNVEAFVEEDLPRIGKACKWMERRSRPARHLSWRVFKKFLKRIGWL